MVKWGSSGRRYQRVDRWVGRELGRIMTLKRNRREELFCPGAFVRESKFGVSSATEQSLPMTFRYICIPPLDNFYLSAGKSIGR